MPSRGLEPLRFAPASPCTGHPWTNLRRASSQRLRGQSGQLGPVDGGGLSTDWLEAGDTIQPRWGPGRPPKAQVGATHTLWIWEQKD